MSFLLILALGAGLGATALAFWLRRPADDRSQEALGLGKGSDLSCQSSAEAATDDANDEGDGSAAEAGAGEQQ